jgi:hypothetical protein
MTTTTVSYEQVLGDALKLSPEDRARLLHSLETLPPLQPRKSLAELAAEQGKKPVDFEELLKLGEFFPAEESVDDLVAFIRKSRSDGQSRSLD